MVYNATSGVSSGRAGFNQQSNCSDITLDKSGKSLCLHTADVKERALLEPHQGATKEHPLLI